MAHLPVHVEPSALSDTTKVRLLDLAGLRTLLPPRKVAVSLSETFVPSEVLTEGAVEAIALSL